MTNITVLHYSTGPLRTIKNSHSLVLLAGSLMYWLMSISQRIRILLFWACEYEYIKKELEYEYILRIHFLL